MRASILAIAVLSLVLPVSASEPGQPLDCSDWVILEPGISCRDVHTCGPTETGSVDFGCASLQGSSTDANGNIVGMERREIGDPFCGYAFRTPKLELKTFDGITERVLAYVDSRCVNATTSCEDRITANARAFDTARGRLLVWLTSSCNNCTPGYRREWIAAFEGFATLFEILQTYTPTANALQFRVPYMPEGMGGADHFDTYWGQLASPIDFTQTHPLQCGYPATPPQVGDYLTVADTLPNPDAGHGYYYVTAATYQGQTRYGRKASGGTLSGRDPALLPACTTERGHGK